LLIPKGEPVSLIKTYESLLYDPIFDTYLAEVELLKRVTMIDAKILISSAEKITELLDN